jgi:hypothetical protein
MVRLEGRQWGLVVLVGLAPFFVAFVLAASAPGIIAPVLGTVIGGASWVLSALLGVLGAALFAGGLGALRASYPGTPTRARQAMHLTAAFLPVGLCLVPALCLLMAGPVLALRLEQGQVAPRAQVTRSPQQRLVEALSLLPRLLPGVKGLRSR